MKHQAVMSYQGCHWSYPTSASSSRPERHWSGTTSGTQKPVEFDEESQDLIVMSSERGVEDFGLMPTAKHMHAPAVMRFVGQTLLPADLSLEVRVLTVINRFA